jgi:hypothetical protein
MAGKVDRNAPCSCGSGRKFKRCCGRDPGVGVTPAFTKAESADALSMLIAFTETDVFQKPYQSGEDRFFGRYFDDTPEEQIEAMFENEHTAVAFRLWLIFDSPILSMSIRVIDAVLEPGSRARFTTGQLVFLERMAASHMRPYEIRRVHLDRGFVFKDLWTEREVEVSERSATRYLEVGDTLCCRLIEGPRGAQEIHGAVFTLRPLDMQTLLRSLRASYRGKLRKRPDLDETQFFKEAAPRIASAWFDQFALPFTRLTTSDGQSVKPQDMLFDVLDRAALIGGLKRCEEIDAESDHEFTWLGLSASGAAFGSTVFASLTLEESRLRAFVMSEERALGLRELLERIAPGAVRYRLSDLHDLNRQLASSSAPPPQREPEIPPALRAQIEGAFFEKYYRDWLDLAIPALGGRTPRHAAKLKSQRARVAALLRGIPPLGDSGEADTDWLWDELELRDLK